MCRFAMYGVIGLVAAALATPALAESHGPAGRIAHAEAPHVSKRHVSAAPAAPHFAAKSRYVAQRRDASVRHSAARKFASGRLASLMSMRKASAPHVSKHATWHFASIPKSAAHQHHAATYYYAARKYNLRRTVTHVVHVTRAGLATARAYRRHPAFARNYWHRAWRAEHRFRVGLYHAPHGWYWRNWAVGADLPHAWWTTNYWLNDWWSFDLPEPPDGYVWVRVGPNAMLIDDTTGRIVEIEYDVFYA